jgi:two-component system OmpR family response regulator
MNYDTRGLKIMVVENDRAVLEMLQIRLEVAGYDTCMARTGTMALETLRGFRPAALVLDLNLPEIDGFGVLEALNPRRERLPFPVLVMARKLGPEDIRRAVGLGARDCVTMPFGGAEVLERIARLVRKPTLHPPAPARAAVSQLV